MASQINDSSKNRYGVELKGPIVKGDPRVGRVPGQVNRHTRFMKDAIVLAAELEGDVSLQDKDTKKLLTERNEETAKRGGVVGYLRWLARFHPATFSTLLGRTIPLQLNVSSTKTVMYESIDEVKAELARAGLTVEALVPVLEARQVSDDEYEAELPGHDD